MLEPPVSSKPPSTSLHKLSWVGLFLAAGALASWVVFGRGGSEGEQATAERVVPAPSAATPAVERRSLMGESAKPGPAVDEASASDKASPGADEAARAETASTLDNARARGNEARSPLTRNASAQRLTRTAPTPQRSSAAEARRKRPARADGLEGTNGDTELDGLFTSPEPPERRVSVDGELEGMFPREEAMTVGANGAPLPD